METKPRSKVYQLLTDLMRGRLSVLDFCDQFEVVYNLEVDRENLSVAERVALDELFKKVVWFSPFPEERAKIPNYLGEEQIMAAVEKAAVALARN
jgi:hypothetical protein